MAGQAIGHPDEYRDFAAYCQKMADSNPNEVDKGQWLSLAQSRLGLNRTRERIPLKAPEAQTRAKGTGQEESEASEARLDHPFRMVRFPIPPMFGF